MIPHGIVLSILEAGKKRNHSFQKMQTSSQALFVLREPLILASSSPRRRDLLRSVGLEFDIVPSNLDEKGDPTESPEMLAELWSRNKALEVAKRHPDAWVLGADTIVVLEGRILGKPKDAGDAFSMLAALSGKTHEVITGICLVRGGRNRCLQDSAKTLVCFKKVSLPEIEAYVKTGEPLDKAGAYGIQGMGAFMVEWVQGSYTNVVGLPLCKVIEWLLQHGVIAPCM